MYIFIMQTECKRHAYMFSGTAHSDRTVVVLLHMNLVRLSNFCNSVSFITVGT